MSDYMMKNEAVLIEQQSSEPPVSLGKAPMSRTLVHRTNKEFDKCAELLRNILTVQESRRNSKSSIGGEINRKSQGSSPNNANRGKKTNTKGNVTKSFIKTNLNSAPDKAERRSSFSPSKSHLSSTGVSAPVEDSTSMLKTRSSPNKSRKHSTRSPSPPSIHHSRLTSPSKATPLIANKSRQKSPPSPIRHPPQHVNTRRRSRPVLRQQELIRSSSCGDLPSSDLMRKQQTRDIIEQFLQHLTRIRTISKQIRTRTSTSFNDSESFRLWNELENSLASALSYANDDIQFQLSLEPLRDEMLRLRKQLQTTNHHLRHLDQRRSDDIYIHPSKVAEKTPIEYSQLLLQNQELKSKCDLLQEKLESLERNNIRLIQRWTQQDLRSLAERTDEIATDNRYLLREEILVLKQKLYHVYDDFATLLNRNHSLEVSNAEQKQQILLYKQQFNDLQQSAQQLLHDLDKRSIEEKIKRFLNQILDSQPSILMTNAFHPSYTTPTKSNPSMINSSVHFLETPHKANGPSSSIPPATSRSRPTPLPPSTKLRPKSLFVTPTVLNDANALSKLQQHRPHSNHDPLTLTPCSSSTICDAESLLTTSSSSSSISLAEQQAKRMTLYTSLPTLNHLPNIDLNTATETQLIHHAACCHQTHNESGPDLDQISDLTSKIFGSDDEVDEAEEDGGIGISETSTSTTLPSDAERLMQM